ncbi:hypothetical protein K440DRAFT_628816 [Wilcoxina mikolae CBS 423.85]|nr:hypothetical protein K440DRAFT_628816 [Wilcoxina mikolae CBS 423.85]
MTLSLETGLRTENWKRPFVTLDSSRWMFEYLKSRNPRLRRLSVEAGTIMHETEKRVGGAIRGRIEQDWSHTLNVTAEYDGTVSVTSSIVEQALQRLKTTPNDDLRHKRLWIQRLNARTILAEEGPLGYTGRL